MKNFTAWDLEFPLKKAANALAKITKLLDTYKWVSMPVPDQIHLWARDWDLIDNALRRGHDRLKNPHELTLDNALYMGVKLIRHNL